MLLLHRSTCGCDAIFGYVLTSKLLLSASLYKFLHLMWMLDVNIKDWYNMDIILKILGTNLPSVLLSSFSHSSLVTLCHISLSPTPCISLPIYIHSPLFYPFPLSIHLSFPPVVSNQLLLFLSPGLLSWVLRRKKLNPVAHISQGQRKMWTWKRGNMVRQHIRHLGMDEVHTQETG